MSKPRFDWWPYAKGIIRRYPQLKAEYSDLHTTSLTASYSSEPHGSGANRTTENIAVRELPTTKQREYEAVRQAIAMTERYKDGLSRLKVIDLVLWRQSHTIAGAALYIPTSERTATQWHGEFIRLVASCYGLMDE